MRISRIVALAAAVFAVSNATAMAAEYHIEGSSPFTVKGEQVPTEKVVFGFDGSSVECKKASSEGTVGSKTFSNFELESLYGECTAFGLNATVTNECNDGFTFALMVLLQFEWAAVYDLVCLAGQLFRVTALTCELQMGSQTTTAENLHGYNQATSPKSVKVVTEVTGLKYKVTKDGIGCPLKGTGEKEDGKISGGVTLKAFQGETQKAFFAE